MENKFNQQQYVSGCGFKKLREDAILPVRAETHSSGYDLFAVENGTLFPGDFKVVPTGVAVSFDKNDFALNCVEGQIRPRSGLAAKYGVTVLNSPGTIDNSFTGELKVVLINHGKTNFSFSKGDRIAQFVFAKVYHPEVVEITGELSQSKESTRKDGGFGSTGK